MFDIVNSGHQTFADFGTSGSFTVNFNLDIAGGNLYLAVGVHYEDHGQSITAVSVDGVSILANLVALGTHGAVSGSDGAVAVYELLAPAAGVAKTISVTMTRASSGINAGIVSAFLFEDANQATPRRAAAAGGGIDVVSTSRNATSALGDIVMDFISVSRTDVVMAANGGQTELINVNSDHRCGVSRKPGADTQTNMGWSWTPARRVGHVAFAVVPLASGTTGDGVQTAPAAEQAASGAESFDGVGAQAAPAAEQAAAGTFGAQAADGDAAQTAPAATQAASGTYGDALDGDAAQTAPAATQSASGAESFDGVAAQTAPKGQSGALIVTGGSIVFSPAPFVETLVLTQPTLIGGGPYGNATQTAPRPVQAAAGDAETLAAAAQTAPAATQSASGAETFTAAGAQTAPAARQAAIGTHGAAHAGNADQTAPAPEQSASGFESFDGAGAQSAPAATQAAAGLHGEHLAGTGAQTAPSPVQAAQSEILVPGLAAQVAPMPRQEAFGGHGDDLGGIGDLFAPMATQAGLGDVEALGFGAQTAPAARQGPLLIVDVLIRARLKAKTAFARLKGTL